MCEDMPHQYDCLSHTIASLPTPWWYRNASLDQAKQNCIALNAVTRLAPITPSSFNSI